MRLRSFLTAVLTLALPLAASARQPVTLSIDPAASSLLVTISIDDRSGWLVVAPTGSLWVDAAGAPNPTSLLLTAAHLDCGAAQVAVPFTPFGTLGVALSDLSASSPPGEVAAAPVGPGGGFTLDGPALSLEGTAAWSASGLLCNHLTGKSIPCAASIALADSGRAAAVLTDGTITVGSQSPPVMSLATTLHAQWPLGPPPGIGTVTIHGSIVASGPASACAADFNASGTVTLGDFFDFLAAWFLGLPGTDANASGGQDIGDIFAFLTAWFRGC